MPKLFFLKITDWFDDIKLIDIIECETNDPNFFNFYGLTKQRIQKEMINVFN